MTSRGVHIHNKLNGFTLVELVVTITIFVIITSVVLINYPLFGEQLGVDLRAQDVALLTRQAQVFALGVRGTNFASAPSYERGVYGIYVTSAQPDRLRFFADRGVSVNKLYDEDLGDCGNESSECVERFNLTRGYYISDICVHSSTENVCGVSELHVTYQRPNPEATIKTGGADLYSYADIVIASPRADLHKKVVVYASGQISVQDAE